MQVLKGLKVTVPGVWRILKKFAPEIQKQRSLLTFAFLALIGETALRLLEPWPLKIIFDRIIMPGAAPEAVTIAGLDGFAPMTLLTIMALAMVGIAALRGMAAYSSTAGMAIAATAIMTDIRGNLYSHLQRLSLSFHSKAKSGDLITRVTSDVERLREVTVVAALPLLTNMMTLVGMVGVMFWLNWELAIISIAIFPLFILSTVRISKKIQKVSRAQRKREGAMAAVAAETMSAIKVVQALSLEELLGRRFTRQNQESLKEGAQAQRLSAGLERTVEVLVAIATALVTWRGVQLVLGGAVTPGDLIVFTSYLKVAFKPMRQLAKYTGQIYKATASGERIVDLLDTVPDIQDVRGAIDAPAFRGAVRFERVSFAYECEKEVLDSLTFKVQPGQHVALVGPSGGGKSTLVSLLLRFYDPIEGQITIDGHDLREYRLESLRRQISIVLQDSILFAASIRENIAYGNLNATEEEVIAAAKLANAHHFITRLPQGYDTIVAERGSTLSGGQRQRIAIARAAVRQSPIVILDEPTTGLDNESERFVSEALDRLTQGRTTFLITHNLRSAVSADQILYIENGSILERGNHAELLQQNGRYANLYRLQSVQAAVDRIADHSGDKTHDAA